MPQWVNAWRIERDVKTVMDNALAVIHINREGKVSTTHNLAGKLSVVAVIGPGTAFGREFYPAVLTEVGLRAAVPYQRSWGANFLELRNRNGQGKKWRRVSYSEEIPPRRACFSLSEDQYYRTAPILFATVQDLANRRISLWQTGGGSERGISIVREASAKVQRKGKREFVRYRRIPLSIRALFPRKETLMVQDILWAELYRNQWRTDYLKEFAGWIKEWLSRYEGRGCSKRDFRNLKGFMGVQRLLRNSPLPFHLKVESLRYLSDRGRYRFYPELMSLLEWDGTPTRAHRMIAVVKNPERRVNNITIHTLGYRGSNLVTQVHKRVDDKIPFQAHRDYRDWAFSFRISNMDEPKKPKIVVVLGPTSSGKSDLGVFLAKKFNGEIISADSRQVYKGLDIGTGKITKREMQGVPHHLLDVASPRSLFSATRYQKLGKQAISKILKKKKVPIIVGGTGLYIDSLIYDYPLPNVKPNPKLRRGLEKLSTAELFNRLKKLDPQRASNIDPKNPRRLIRALEILKKQPIPSYNSVIQKESPYKVIKVGIKKDSKILKELIHKRLQKRIKQGLIKEVENLLKNKLITHKRLELLGLEYRYVSRHILGKLNKQEMIGQLESEIYKYAKRQMTWFKKDTNIIWEISPRTSVEKINKFLKNN